MTKSLGQIAYEADFVNATFLCLQWKGLRPNAQAGYESMAQAVAAHIRAAPAAPAVSVEPSDEAPELRRISQNYF